MQITVSFYYMEAKVGLRVERLYNMFYAIGYMEKANCMDVKYSSFNSTVRFVILLPGSFVPNAALQCLQTVILNAAVWFCWKQLYKADFGQFKGARKYLIYGKSRGIIEFKICYQSSICISTVILTGRIIIIIIIIIDVPF